MSKHSYKKRRLKYVFLAFTCATAFAFSGIASACDNNSSDDDEKDKTTSKEDTQLLKNGNFEFFNIPEKKKDGNEPEYLIKTPENWTHGGTSSSAMSGIISTSDTAWAKMEADNLASVLDYNNSLDSSSSSYLSDYVDYNGMKSSDILYQDQYKALKEEDEDDTDTDNDDPDGDETDPKAIIANPGTRYNVKKNESDGLLYTDGGNGDRVYENEKGEYFLEYNKDKNEYSKPISNVLMLHNYASSHNGIAQNYSSVEIELPANTAAEISVWVKTSYLLFSQGKNVNQDRGANISVSQTVGSSTIDKFTVSCINTEKLLGTGYYENRDAVAEDKYNGWIQYTVYVNACDFASSKIKLELGLGETNYLTEGYAFFDDVTVTKYASLDDSKSYQDADKDNLVTCNLSTDASEKIFKADSLLRNEGLGEGIEEKDPRYSENFQYRIDLASENLEYGDNNINTYAPVTFGGLKTGYTIDDNHYVSSNLKYEGDLIGFTDASVNLDNQTSGRLPFKSPLTTSDDLLALVNSDHEFKANETDYYEKLNNALNSAIDLPKNDVSYNNNMLVMLSAYGAAYTTSFELKVPKEGYQIVSFWVKTSDMEGSTAATVSITQKDNDENTSSFSLDTTGTATNIGNEENEIDIFNGWVQCFFFVHNELESEQTFTVKFSFGNTTIKDTDVRSYKNGWVALANMQALNVNEKIFSYTGSGDNIASLTISEEAKKSGNVFDEASGNEAPQIKTDMVIPANYNGVNGGSSAIVNNGFVSNPFDDTKNNEYDGKKFAGLINKEHFIPEDSSTKSEYSKAWWYNSLLNNFNASGLSATDAWNTVFGTQSVQPLIITNVKKEIYTETMGATEDTYTTYYIKDGDGYKLAEGTKFDEKETYYDLKTVMNFGYIGEETQVSDDYKTVSVRVKVSKGAIAYVYLVDTSAGKNVLTFDAPSYSFYYDIDGNVLKDKPASDGKKQPNILYSLRSDGLYEDESGKLFANTWNYKKLYYIENMTYYDEEGNEFNIDQLVDGVKYYDGTGENRKEANHYLVTGDGTKVYHFTDGAYHYIVEGKTQSETVHPFDVQYARYTVDQKTEDGEIVKTVEDYKEAYMVEVVGNDHLENGVPQWVNVSFVIRAGSEAKSYRLELWSGKREEMITTGNNEGGTVIFDYNYTSSSDAEWKELYEDRIIYSYKQQLAEKEGALDNIETSDMNIRDWEKLAIENGINIDDSYKAHYYTYSLYDSADYKPFNKDVASDGATGYDYSVSDQTETLVYLQVKNRNSYTIFADYSEIDKSITLNNPADPEPNPDPKPDSSSDGSIWLLASSIVLVIALIFAIIAIFLKDALKKARRNKVTSKNNYDQRKTNRYKRKLHLKNEEIVEVDAIETKTDADVDSEKTEETPAGEESVDEAVGNEPESTDTSYSEEDTSAGEETSKDDGESE